LSDGKTILGTGFPFGRAVLQSRRVGVDNNQENMRTEERPTFLLFWQEHSKSILPNTRGWSPRDEGKSHFYQARRTGPGRARRKIEARSFLRQGGCSTRYDKSSHSAPKGKANGE